MSHHNHFLRKLRLFFAAIAVVLLSGVALVRVQHAQADVPPVTIDSVTLSSGETLNMGTGSVVYTSAGSVNVSGHINLAGGTITHLTSYATYPSAMTDIAWTKGNTTWDDVVTFDSLPVGTSFTVTYVPSTDSSAYLPTTSFTIFRTATTAAPTAAINCTLAGAVKNANISGSPLNGVTLKVQTSSNSAYIKTTQSANGGHYSVSSPLDLRIKPLDWVTITPTLNNFSGSAVRRYVKDASSCPPALDIIMTQNGSGNPDITNGGDLNDPFYVTLTGTARSVFGPVISGATVKVISLGQTYSTVSLNDGTYTISNIKTYVGAWPTITAPTFNSYTFSGPQSFWVSSKDITTYKSNVLFNPPPTNITGSVYKHYGNTNKSVPAAYVTLTCDNGDSKNVAVGNLAARQDGTFTFNNVNPAFTNCRVYSSLGTGMSDTKTFPTLAPAGSNIAYLTINTDASLTIEVDYPAFYDDFGQIEPAFQPDSDSPRVAFHLTFIQGGVTTDIIPAVQIAGPVVLTGRDASVPYEIHIGENSEGRFGNQAYDSGQRQLKPGNDNTAEDIRESNQDGSIELDPGDPNLLTATVTDPTGAANNACINVYWYNPDSSFGGLHLSECLPKSRAKQSGNSFVYTFTETKTSEKPSFLPGKKYNVATKPSLNDDFSNPSPFFTFSGYYSTKNTVSLTLTSLPFLTYKINGMVHDWNSLSGLTADAVNNATVTLTGFRGGVETAIGQPQISRLGQFSFDNISSSVVSNYDGFKVRATAPGHGEKVVTVDLKNSLFGVENVLFYLPLSDVSSKMCRR